METVLITGPAKTGKTEFVLNEFIKNIDNSPLLILPNTFQIKQFKKRLIKKLHTGFIGNRILTFNNIVNLYLEEYYLPIQPISESIKIAILAKIITKLNLQYFKKIQGLGGFHTLVSDYIAELKMGHISPESFLNAIEKRGIKEKDKELYLLYAEYEKELKRKRLYDRESWMELGIQMLREHPVPPSLGNIGLVFVDNFYTFTPLEINLLQELWRKTSTMYITLTHIHNDPREELFRTTRKTYTTLKEVFTPRELEFTNPLMYPPFKDIIQNIYLPTRIGRSTEERISIYAVPNRERELVEVAHLIKSLISSGIEPEDIAVTSRELMWTYPGLEQIWMEYDIPFRIHSSIPILHTPVAKVLLKLLEIILQNYRRESVLSFLKSNYSNFSHFSKTRVYHLELISYKKKIIDGKQNWLNRLEDHKEEQKVMEDFFTLLSCIPTEGRLREFIDGLWHILDQMNLSRILRNSPPSILCQETEIIKRLSETLSTLKHLYGDIHITINQFYSYLLTIMSHIYLPYPVPLCNAVNVVDFHMLRGLSVPVLIIMRFNEDLFPRRFPEDPLYSDIERTELVKLGLNLEPVKEREKEEMLLFYNLISSVQEKLYLFYSYADMEGNPKLPSIYLNELINILTERPEINRIPLNAISHPVNRCCTKNELFTSLMDNLYSNHPNSSEEEIISAYNTLINQPHIKGILANGLFERKRASDPQDIWKEPSIRCLMQIFPPEYRFSPTQLEEYKRCPFLFLYKHILRIEEFQLPEQLLTPSEEGTLYHSILCRFYLQQKGKNTAKGLTKDLETELIKIASEEFKKVEEDGLINSYSIWEYRKRYILNTLLRFLRYDFEYLSMMPNINPGYFEFSFGVPLQEHGFDPASTPEPLILQKDGERIFLQGRIDRIDLLEPDGFSVIDYKTGKSYYSKPMIKEGLHLQLPVYILAVKQLLYPERKWYKASIYTINTPDRYESMKIEHYKWKGDKLRENPEADELINSALNHIFECIHGIRDGNFAVQDQECPPYCGYRTICRKI